MLLKSASANARPLRFSLFDGRPSPLPILRTLQTLVGIREELASVLRTALGARAARLEDWC